MEDKIILTADTCCDTIPNCDCGMPELCVCDEPMKPVNINSVEEDTHTNFVKLAAVLQDSVLYSWKMHLKAKKYSVHMILEEYYNDAFDIIDDLIEHYQGICNCDIIDDNVIPELVKSDDPLIYFASLKHYLFNFSNNQNNFNEKTLEIKSDIDDLMRLIDSTLYKLSHLTESKIKSFNAFIYENLR